MHGAASRAMPVPGDELAERTTPLYLLSLSMSLLLWSYLFCLLWLQKMADRTKQTWCCGNTANKAGTNPATRNRTRDHLIAAVVYSQMLYQLSYSRFEERFALIKLYMHKTEKLGKGGLLRHCVSWGSTSSRGREALLVSLLHGLCWAGAPTKLPK